MRVGGRGEEIYWEGGRRYTGRVGGRGEDISKIHLIDMSKK